MDLSDKDTDIIINKEPDTFIEAITANALFGRYADRPQLVRRHQSLFKQWLQHYDRQTLEKVQKQSTERQNRIVRGLTELHQQDLDKARKAAMLEILRLLPMKQKRFNRHVVDMEAVNEMIKELET